MDRLYNDDGTLYGPRRFKEIVKERYIISKNINTSYNDTGKITPLERRYLLEFILDDLNTQKKLIDDSKSHKENN